MPTENILLAYPEEWNVLSNGELLNIFLHGKGYDVITAFSYEDAREIIHSQDLSAIVMCSDWAIKQENGLPGLMVFLKGRVPTMSLITTTTYRNCDNWLHELFDPRQHEYQHMPADIDALIVWLDEIKQKS